MFSTRVLFRSRVGKIGLSLFLFLLFCGATFGQAPTAEQLKKLPALSGLEVTVGAAEGAGFSGTIGTQKTPISILSAGTNFWDVALKAPDFSLVKFAPKLANTPLGDLALENVCFLIAPNGGTIKPEDVPSEALKTSFVTMFGAGNEITLTAGVNFFGTVKSGKTGVWGLLKTQLGIGDTPMTIYGSLGGTFLANMANGTAPSADGSVTALDLNIKLPAINPVGFPSAIKFSSTKLNFNLGGDGKSITLKTVVTGGSELTIKDKVFTFESSLELAKTTSGNEFTTKFNSTMTKGATWAKPAGLDIIDLDNLSFYGETLKNASNSTMLFGLKGEVKVKGVSTPIGVAGELTVLSNKFDDFTLRLTQPIKFAELPGINLIPGVDKVLTDFSLSEVWVSLHGFGGTLSWTPVKGATPLSASYLLFVNKIGETTTKNVSFFLKFAQLDFKSLFPKLPLPIVLPSSYLIISKGGFTESLSDMPLALQSFFSDLNVNPNFEFRILDGVNLICAFDPAKISGKLKDALTKIGISDPLVLSGAIGGLFGQGVPSFQLYARLPAFNLPPKMPKVLSFAKSVGSTFFLKLTTNLEFSVGVGLDFNVVLDKNQVSFGGEVAATVAADSVGVSIAGKMMGQWNDMFGLPGINASDVILKFTLEADSSIGLVAAGNAQIGPRVYQFEGLCKILPEAYGLPKEIALDFRADKIYALPILNNIELGEILIKSMTAAAGKVIIKLIPDPKKRAIAQATFDKVCRGESLMTILKIDQLPIFQFRDFHIKLVTPGATDPSLKISGPAAALAGKLIFADKEIAICDSFLDLTGLKISGSFLLKKVGPLTISTATVDIAANLSELPHFYVALKTELFGAKKDVLLSFGLDGFKLSYEDDFGKLFKYKFEAETKGKDITSITDFTVHSKLSTDLNAWLQTTVKNELKSWNLDPQYQKAQADLTNAINEVNKMDTLIAMARIMVNQDRAKVQATVDGAWKAFNDMQTQINNKQSEYNSHAWWCKACPRASQLFFEIAGLGIAIGPVRAYYEVVKSGLKTFPVDSDPRVWPLILGRNAAVITLNICKGVVAVSQKFLTDLQKFAVTLIDEATKLPCLVVRNAEFSGSLQAAIGNAPFKFDLDIDVFGKPIPRVSFNFTPLKPEEVGKLLTNLVKDVIIPEIIKTFKIKKGYK